MIRGVAAYRRPRSVHYSGDVEILGTTQGLIIWVLTAAAIGLKGFALIDAVRVPTAAFPAAGKLTKPLWLTFLGVALLVNVAVFSPLHIVNLLGVVAAAVYLVDVRPAVAAYRGGGRRGSQEGPYGPW